MFCFSSLLHNANSCQEPFAGNSKWTQPLSPKLLFFVTIICVYLHHPEHLIWVSYRNISTWQRFRLDSWILPGPFLLLPFNYYNCCVYHICCQVSLETNSLYIKISDVFWHWRICLANPIMITNILPPFLNISLCRDFTMD